MKVGDREDSVWTRSFVSVPPWSSQFFDTDQTPGPRERPTENHLQAFRVKAQWHTCRSYWTTLCYWLREQTKQLIIYSSLLTVDTLCWVASNDLQRTVWHSVDDKQDFVPHWPGTGCLQLLEILKIYWNFVNSPGKIFWWSDIFIIVYVAALVGE